MNQDSRRRLTRGTGIDFCRELFDDFWLEAWGDVSFAAVADGDLCRLPSLGGADHEHVGEFFFKLRVA